MRPSRGMGAMMPDKMPKGKKKARRDDTDFTGYKEGGEVESKKTSGSVLAVRGKKGGMLDKLQRAPLSKMVGKKEGGKVNEAGNYTKPGLRKRIFNSIKAAAVQGTGAGQWSARKAQLMAKRYKASGGGYK